MLKFGQNMTSRVDFGWKPTTTAIFVGIRHVGVNAPHHFSQKPPLNCEYVTEHLEGKLLPHAKVNINQAQQIALEFR